MHPEKVLNYLPDLSDAQIAYLFGMPEADYRKVKQAYDDEAKEAAVKLLADRAFAEKVKRLPVLVYENTSPLAEHFRNCAGAHWYIQHALPGIPEPAFPYSPDPVPGIYLADICRLPASPNKTGSRTAGMLSGHS